MSAHEHGHILILCNGSASESKQCRHLPLGNCQTLLLFCYILYSSHIRRKFTISSSLRIFFKVISFVHRSPLRPLAYYLEILSSILMYVDNNCVYIFGTYTYTYNAMLNIIVHIASCVYL